MPKNLLYPHNVPIPQGKDITLFRNKRDGFYYYKKSDNSIVELALTKGNLYYIREEFISKIHNHTGETFDLFSTDEGIAITFFNSQTIAVAGGGGGGTGRSGFSGFSGAGGGGGNVESGTFQYLAISGSGILVTPTVNRVKLIFFNVRDSGDDYIFSDGRSDGGNQCCIWNSLYAIGGFPPPPDQYAMASDQSNCIHINTGANTSNNGYSAVVSAIADTSFTLSFTIIGTGRDIDVMWHAITE